MYKNRSNPLKCLREIEIVLNKQVVSCKLVVAIWISSPRSLLSLSIASVTDLFMVVKEQVPQDHALERGGRNRQKMGTT